MPPLARGAYIAEHQVILVNRDLHPWEQDAVLSHEIAHIDLRHHDHPPPGGWFAARYEHDANRTAARRLIDDVDELAEAMALHPHDLGAAADCLEVTTEVLLRRIGLLTRAEEAIIVDRLDRIERVC